MIAERPHPLYAGGVVEQGMRLAWQKIRFDLFTSSMGTTGLGLAWRTAATTLGAPRWIGELILLLASLLFVVLIILHVIRAVVHPGALREEWQHPTQFLFFPAAAISGSLLASAALPYSVTLAKALWVPIVCFQWVLLILTMRRWILGSTKVSDISPNWLIPMVGNASPSFAGVPLGFISMSKIMLMSALICWLWSLPLFLYRIMLVQPKIPEKAMPSLAILVSAPAVISIGFHIVDSGISTLSMLMAFSSLFFAICIASLGRRLIAASFSRAWWGFTFPSTALASALMWINASSHQGLDFITAVITLGTATLIVVTVFFISLKSGVDYLFESKGRAQPLGVIGGVESAE